MFPYSTSLPGHDQWLTGRAVKRTAQAIQAALREVGEGDPRIHGADDEPEYIKVGTTQFLWWGKPSQGQMDKRRSAFERGHTGEKVLNPSYWVRRAGQALKGRTSEREIRQHLRHQERRLYGTQRQQDRRAYGSKKQQRAIDEYYGR